MMSEPAGLSKRALRFLEQSSRRPAVDQSPLSSIVIDTAGLMSEAFDLDEIRRLIHGYYRGYEGRSLDVAGGPLSGGMILGCGVNPRLRRSWDGFVMFRAARHRDAQCDIVISENGAFGCSWGDEFHVLFDSVEKFIEDSAVWEEFRGWHYAARLDGELDGLLGLISEVALDPILSEGSITWWIGRNIAIGSHPYLNPARSANNQSTVLVRDAEDVPGLIEAMCESGFSLPVGMRKAMGVVG
ncbi:hypothetical protein [Streptomyces sp. NPDC001269]